MLVPSRKVAYLDSENVLIGYGQEDGETGPIQDGLAPAEHPEATYRVKLVSGCDLPTNGTYYYDMSARTFVSGNQAALKASIAVGNAAGALLAAALKAREQGTPLPPEMNEALDKMIYPAVKNPGRR